MIEMKALRKFRMMERGAMVWVVPDDIYFIPDTSVDFHEKTKRGERVTKTPIKAGPTANTKKG